MKPVGQHLEIIVAGETLHLLPQRGLYWPGAGALFIADPHFGKAAAFAHAGIPVPATTRAELDSLDAMLEQTQARRLIVLGDFFHARTARDEPTLAALTGWRRKRCDLGIVLVRGNHDDHAGDPPDDWRFTCVSGIHEAGPFACVHDAEAQRDASGYVLAGHVHPGVVLRDSIGSSLRLPCFHFNATRALLPAFGRFTGCVHVKHEPGDRVFAVSPTAVVQVR